MDSRLAEILDRLESLEKSSNVQDLRRKAG
jgi:hypothetical protein